jgi:hypothetical protein
MTVNKTLKNIYALYVFGKFKLYFQNLAIRAITFHKNVRMCRKNKFQVETMKINSPKKNLAMWSIERFWNCSL